MDNTGGADAGAAYLFSTNGALLTTFTNPTPANVDYFGCSLAAMAGDRFLIGSFSDNAGVADTGVAYLYSAAVPTLAIRRTTTNTVAVSWPSPATGWMLQQNTNGASSMNWSNVTIGIIESGTNKVHIVNPPTGSRFYRLFKP